MTKTFLPSLTFCHFIYCVAFLLFTFLTTFQVCLKHAELHLIIDPICVTVPSSMSRTNLKKEENEGRNE